MVVLSRLKVSTAMLEVSAHDAVVFVVLEVNVLAIHVSKSLFNLFKEIYI
jgi:hypothetical protein